jgi:Leucine-rich repeat (LRR) protein
LNSGNKIEEIEGLNSCFKLKELSLCDNKLTTLKGLGRLLNLDVRLACFACAHVANAHCN